MLTLVWVVGITNAFNLLDNMDGLAAGMARHRRELPAGALPARRATWPRRRDRRRSSARRRGFLVRNFPPAPIFMGDAGSLFVGFFLGGLCLVVDAAYYSRGITAVLAVPVLLVLIPIFDTTFVTVTRLLARAARSRRAGATTPRTGWWRSAVSERRALAVLFGLSIIGGRRRAPHVPAPISGRPRSCCRCSWWG